MRMAVRRHQPISVNALHKHLGKHVGALSTVQERVRRLVREGRLVEDAQKRIGVSLIDDAEVT